MRSILVPAELALAVGAGLAPAQAGCPKGAFVGGVAGAAAGHPVAGAAAGCAIGHHQSNKKEKQQQANAQRKQPANGAPQNGTAPQQ